MKWRVNHWVSTTSTAGQSTILAGSVGVQQNFQKGKELFGIFFILRLGNFFWIPVWEGFPLIFLYFALDFPGFSLFFQLVFCVKLLALISFLHFSLFFIGFSLFLQSVLCVFQQLWMDFGLGGFFFYFPLWFSFIFFGSSCSSQLASCVILMVFMHFSHCSLFSHWVVVHIRHCCLFLHDPLAMKRLMWPHFGKASL